MEYQVELLKPAISFIHILPIKIRAKIYRTINLLEIFGDKLPEPHAKTLKGCQGLKELRVKFASNIFRLFYFHFHDRVYIVTSGYQKKDRKTDKKQIKRALRLMNEFLKEEL